MQREVIRDLHALCFIIEKYFDRLNNDTLYMLGEAVPYRGTEYCDEIVLA